MSTAPSALAPEDKRVNLYRLVLVTSIVLNLTVGVFILLWPDAFASFLNQPAPFPKTWPRHWGAQLLAINMLYMPGYGTLVPTAGPTGLGSSSV